MYDSKLVYCCQNVTFEEGREFAKQITDDHE
jgi:LacI family transcriptional regulator